MLIIKILARYYKSVIYAVFVLVISLIPFKDTPGSGIFNFPHMDKIIHFFLYGILCFLLLWDSRNKLRKKDYILIILLCLSFGGIIELLQISQPERSGDIFDLIANFFGSLVAVPVFNYTTRLR